MPGPFRQEHPRGEIAATTGLGSRQRRRVEERTEADDFEIDSEMIGDLAGDPRALARSVSHGQVEGVHGGGARSPDRDRGGERAVHASGQPHDEPAPAGIVEGLAQGEGERARSEVGIQPGDALDCGGGAQDRASSRSPAGRARPGS